MFFRRRPTKPTLALSMELVAWLSWLKAVECFINDEEAHHDIVSMITLEALSERRILKVGWFRDIGDWRVRWHNPLCSCISDRLSFYEGPRHIKALGSKAHRPLPQAERRSFKDLAIGRWILEGLEIFRHAFPIIQSLDLSLRIRRHQATRPKEAPKS